MPTSLPSGVDPALYVHPLSQQRSNIQYGSHPDYRVDHYRNSLRTPGGNALLIEVHGGSWKANDKTLFATSSGGAGLAVYFTGFLLNSAAQGTTRIYFDVAGAEYAPHAHEGINSDYERWYDDTTHGRIGCVSRRRYLLSSVQDIQRVVQHFKRYAADYDINPARIFLLGHSVGGNTCIGAAHTPSRGWNPNAKSRWAAHHDSRVAGVINLSGEVNLDPWFVYHRHARYCAGIFQADTSINGVRGDMERLFLKPNASGLYPQGSPKTDICKALSPVDQVAAAPRYLASTRIRSYYFKDFNTVSPYAPPGVFENPESAPLGDYVSNPPWDSAGHFYTQFNVLDAACVANDAARGDGLRKHWGRVLDAVNFYPTVVGLNPPLAPNGQPILAAQEAMLQESYDWMCDLMEGIEPDS